MRTAQDGVSGNRLPGPPSLVATHAAVPPARYEFVILALIVLAVFGALGLGRFGYTSILPAMQEALRLTNTQTGELQSWNLTGYLLTAMLAGLLAARYGPRVVISCALFVAAVGLLVTGFVPTFEGARVG